MTDLSGIYSISGRPVSADWVVIGDHSYYARYLAVGSWLPTEKILIGKYCSIGDQVSILTGGNRRTDLPANYPVAILKESYRTWGSKSVGLQPHIRRTLAALYECIPFFLPGSTYKTTSDTTLGNDVWVGFGAMITGGVNVGDGAVVASGSVVFSDVPPYAIVAGNPAQLIRYRFSRDTVQRLLRIRWWDWSDDVIRSRIDWFHRPIADFVDYFDPKGALPIGRVDTTAP